MCFQLTLQKLSMVNNLLFHHVPSRYQCMMGTLTFIALLTLWLVMKLVIWTEYPSFPHEDVPSYYDASHHQLKDEELLIYNDLDFTILDSWTLERDTRAQANSLTWMEQEKNRVTASKFWDVYNWKRGMEKHAENYVAGTQLHQHFYNSDLIMAECTSPLLGKKVLWVLCFPSGKCKSFALWISSISEWIAYSKSIWFPP